MKRDRRALEWQDQGGVYTHSINRFLPAPDLH